MRTLLMCLVFFCLAIPAFAVSTCGPAMPTTCGPALSAPLPSAPLPPTITVPPPAPETYCVPKARVGVTVQRSRVNVGVDRGYRATCSTPSVCGPADKQLARRGGRHREKAVSTDKRRGGRREARLERRQERVQSKSKSVQRQRVRTSE